MQTKMWVILETLLEWRLYAQIFGLFMIVIMMYAERTNPEKIPLWTFAFIAFPLMGVFTYLAIGQTFYAEHTFRLKGLNDNTISQAQKIDEYLRECEEENLDAEVTSVMRAISNIGGSIYSNNNCITLYTDGNDFFDRMFEDMENAESFIHLEYFILRDDDLGNRFMDLITKKAAEGVKVRLVIDYLGFQKELLEPIREFKDAGGEFTTFHRVPTLLFSPKKNNRNHRKLTIIDGHISYCGGYNIGDEYLGKGEVGNWRDSGVRIQGGGTIPINIRFLMDWNYANRKSNKPVAMNENMVPLSAFEHYGDERMQLVSGGPDIAWKNPVRLQYMEMIKVAKNKVWIHTPYLIPNDSLMDALTLAAASGVDVKIIIPDHPDHPFVYWNNLFSANKLMEAGVRIFHYHKGFVHSKTIVVDDMFCSVGSANIDDRSLVHNFESNAMIYSERIAQELSDAFLEDLEHCTEYSCEEYSKRTNLMKLKISISKLFKSLT